MTGRRSPHLYEVNARRLARRLSERDGKAQRLMTVPVAWWRRLREMGFDLVWVMGVWERSPASRQCALSDPTLRLAYAEALPGWTAADVAGSPYATYSYGLDPILGREGDLARLRKQLNDMGLGLILDFVPNHVARDHPWTGAHPERFIQASDRQAEEHPDWFFSTPAGVRLAHGRDPHFPPWTDTAQVNVFSEDLRGEWIQELLRIAEVADGVRCDMAMLALHATFDRVWGAFVGHTAKPRDEFWGQAISTVKRRHPRFLFLAEAYWGLEAPLRALGFDYVYDKGLYDRLRDAPADDVRAHLQAQAGLEDRMVRFIENHDEDRAVTALGRARSQAAAVVLATVPGMRLFHDGQLEGCRRRAPIQLLRAPDEPVDEALRRFYAELLGVVNASIFHEGQWSLVPVGNQAGAGASGPLLAWSWARPETSVTVIVNYSDTATQGALSLSWTGPGGASQIDRQVLAGHGEARQDGAKAGTMWRVSLAPWSSVMLCSATGQRMSSRGQTIEPPRPAP